MKSIYTLFSATETIMLLNRAPYPPVVLDIRENNSRYKLFIHYRRFWD